MRSISVLHVGDGACSVLRGRCSWDDYCDRTAIIDCGSNDRRARSAAQLLAQHLTPRDWRSLSELVVTHFDADHWEGLLRVVDSAPAGPCGVSPDLRIFFPAVPSYVDRRLPAAVMALITATGPFGVQALDLRAAWSRLTRVQLVPLAQGSSFSLAGRRHEVVWPPRQFEGPSAQRLNRLVQRIDEEAERLARNGYPRLQESLHEAYRNGPFNRRSVHTERTARDRRDLGHPELETQEIDEELQDLPSDNVPNSAIPRDWARNPDFRTLVKDARAAQNHLSLVFHDPIRASLLVFGDAPPSVVKHVAGRLRADSYQVALAPHHGSQELPNSAPGAETCVSQGGQRLSRLWYRHTRSHVNNDKCLHTSNRGNIARDLRLSVEP